MINDLLKNKALVGIGVLLILFGLLKPDLSKFSLRKSDSITINNNEFTVTVPANKDLKEAAEKVTDCLRSGSSSRKTDGIKLASLYNDLANLITIDGDDQVIKSTLEIREANKLAGLMYHLDLHGKYKELSLAANNVLVIALGEDEAVLDETLRAKAVESFKALSWACYEGSK